ncbi:alkaline phosphatase family protein [Halosimplex rubrum]|uniref:Alkaline phosphatase family protein n=1 Tax=Halosimplex rubrum TaxID=869889 RepID=A0A7D5P3F4_9EURY|nr:alkaline phosphatase family protein [Halosimplex rubrum]
MGVDKADTTELVDSVDVADDEGGFEIAITPADGVALGTDLNEDADALEYTHTELPDIADEADAYSLIPGRFYLNLEGREPRGSVPEEEYEQVRSELKEELEAMEGPDGEPVADRVVTKEDAFRGDHDDIAPDLTIVPNHGFDLKAGFKGRKNPFVEFSARNGMHSFDNATLLIDDEEARVSDVDLFDIAPTILDLMDVDYERGEFDGTSLV